MLIQLVHFRSRGESNESMAGQRMMGRMRSRTTDDGGA